MYVKLKLTQSYNIIILHAISFIFGQLCHLATIGSLALAVANKIKHFQMCTQNGI